MPTAQRPPRYDAVVMRVCFASGHRIIGRFKPDDALESVLGWCQMCLTDKERPIILCAALVLGTHPCPHCLAAITVAETALWLSPIEISRGARKPSR